MSLEDRFKFRLWDKNNKVMHYNAEYISSGNSGNDWIIFKSDKQELEKGKVFNNPYFRQQFIIMQSTGLKDSKGNLIYEGDKLGGFWEDLYIGYCENCKQFQVISKDFGCMACEGDVHWYEVVEEDGKLEVIGNIYENKEILESEG